MPAYADNPDEYFDTYTREGKPLGPVKRSIVHAEGIWHKAVNVLLYRTSGALVIQQRAAQKSVCPLAWDLSVAEHLQVSESWESAAMRGLQEELGVEHINLTQCGGELMEQFDLHLGQQQIHNYEFQRCYQGVTDAPIRVDPIEVKSVREISLTELMHQMHSEPQQFTPWFVRWAHELKLFQGTSETGQ